MHTRREFLSLAACLAGGAGVLGGALNSIARALAIEPAAGSSFLDAEHIVILMQENRSFDHAYGTLRGVRGFNDQRAITLPDGNPVWVQANASGERFTPFRFDIKSSKITWMGSLPHSWPDQVDARNGGMHDKWLPAKRSGHREYAGLPLTLGYYTREDIPFYYALADAFTICDQYFCSSLTGTTPNRCYLWTGTIRERMSAAAPANVRNSEVDHDEMAGWPTFPERLEDHGVSWKVYQNEVSMSSGLDGDEDSWLSNFTDNPLEFFRQYNVRLAANHRSFVDRRIRELPAEIERLRRQPKGPRETTQERAARRKRLDQLSAQLRRLQAERAEWAGKSLAQLAPRERALHARAFTTNAGDPSYRQLEELDYREGGAERKLRVPKGDVLHQFREDVKSGNLPAVSWLVSPESFSDHPSSAWYGAWYIAEALNILTHNPEVWKKTIFLLTYDENDGYFDHVPPFVAPRPRHPETGRVTAGIDASLDYVEFEQDRKRNEAHESRGDSIGLGFRVPMVIASPWSRGGCVCSQVFDHTSVLQLLEKWLTHRLGKPFAEPNITPWRRAVCGDLTASFQSSADVAGAALEFPPRDAFLESIHRAQFKGLPTGFHALDRDDLDQIRRDPASSKSLPRQEPGVRKSCPLPYQLAVDGALNDARTHFNLRFEAGNQVFGPRSAGSPFLVYALGPVGPVKVRSYAVEAGTHLEDAWSIGEFKGGRYHLRAYGPNGFYREFTGGADDPSIELKLDYARSSSNGRTLTGDVAIVANNGDARRRFTIEIADNAYSTPMITRTLAPGERATLAVATQKSAGWYDVSVRLAGSGGFAKRFAGRVETGQWSTSDPAMGGAPG